MSGEGSEPAKWMLEDERPLDYQGLCSMAPMSQLTAPDSRCKVQPDALPMALYPLELAAPLQSRPSCPPMLLPTTEELSSAMAPAAFHKPPPPVSQMGQQLSGSSIRLALQRLVARDRHAA